MSNAERQRRFIDRLRGTGTTTSSSLLETEYAKLETECTKLKCENSTLKLLLDGAEERVSKLEARRERPRPPKPVSGSIGKRANGFSKKVLEVTCNYHSATNYKSASNSSM
jgi:hypothetical protein